MKKIFYSFVLLIMLYNFTLAQSSLDTIQVSTGWNNIGALSSGATIDIIDTEPPGIITSTFFGFNPGGGYYSADTLNRGDGYWVKVSQNGKIIIGLTSPFVCGTSQVYYSGRYYNTVQISTQCWLKENLDVGTRIDGVQNQTNNGIIEKYCYGNDAANCTAFGGLYQWDEAMQYTTIQGSQGICPLGWHLPTNAEFEALNTVVGGNGNTLKAVGQGTGSGAGTNSSDFSAFLAGNYHYNGYFENLFSFTRFWSSNEWVTGYAYALRLDFDNGGIYLGGYPDMLCFSVRCLKN